MRSLDPSLLDLAGPDRPAIPAWLFEAERAQAVIILMAALGVSARFYRPLAEALQRAGFDVLLLEQRGHGESPLRPGWRTDWSFREPLLEEIPAALERARGRASALPVYVMGHSLGGHYASMTAGRLPGAVDGVILVGCSSPWVGGFEGKTRSRIKLLHAIIPLAARTLGAFPGDWIGFGGREARGVMRDWLAFSRSNRYAARGVDQDLEAGIAGFTGPVLSVRLADDDFAPEAGVEAVLGKYARAAVTRRALDARELGVAADHFRWARTPDAVVREILAWHATNRASRADPA